MAELPDRSDSRAILIGTGTYRNTGFPALPAVANSLASMRDVLTDPELGGWPGDRVTILEDPADVRLLVPELRELVEKTEGTLFLYYAGHGIVLPNGQLCLALADTGPRNADIDGLTYQKVRELLLSSPAQVIAVVLDCCYSGRAVTALSGPDGGSLDIKGVYTLAAAAGPAHVVPLDEQALTATSFTRELVELVRAGVPAGPALLTFGTLYKHLVRRLDKLGLPEPVQGNTDTANDFPFARNAAHRTAVRAVERYARAMADAFAPCREQGITKEHLAQALSLSGRAMDGYLSGRRIAPEDVLLDFIDLLKEQGCGLDAAAEQELTEVRAAAEAAVAADPDQGPALQEYNRELAAEARDLRAVLARERAEHAQAASEADEKLSRLTREVEKQREQLGHAADLVREVEAENRTLEAKLAGIRSEADRVARELRVLRAQLTGPMDPPARARDGDAVPVGAAVTPTAVTPTPTAATPVRPPLAADQRSGDAGGAGTTSRPHGWRPPPPRPRSAARLVKQVKGRWDRSLVLGQTSVSVAVVTGLLCVVLGIVWGVLQHPDAVGDLSAKPCAAADSGRGDCLAPATGQVANKTTSNGENGSTWTLTVALDAHQHDYDVSGELYDAVQVGGQVDLKIWKGEIVQAGHDGRFERVRSDTPLPAVLAGLLFTGGVVLAAAAVLRARPSRVVFAFVWISVWTTDAGADLIGATSWFDWLVAPVLLVIGFIGLAVLV